VSVSASWFDTAKPEEFCGMKTPQLEAAAFHEFETSWNAAFRASGGKACGGQTARQIFDRIKDAQIKAVATPPDLTGFDALATACAVELTHPGNPPGFKGFGLWSGGYACSKVASSLFKVITLETKPKGSIVDGILSSPKQKPELADSWKKCAAKMWNSLSVKFVEQMRDTVTVFFRYAGTDSVLYRQELPALQKLLESGAVKKVIFEVVLQDADGCGVHDGFKREVVNQREKLKDVLVDVATKINTAKPKSVATVSARAPPRGGVAAHIRARRNAILQPRDQ